MKAFWGDRLLNIPKFRENVYKKRFERYVERVLGRGDVFRIFFGSVSRGEERPFLESDIDVLVLADNLPENPSMRRMATLKYREDLGIIEDIWLTPKELLDAVEGDGVSF